ncbi:hypothetical protein CPB85DRAFT_1256967 [Mucidula mucida]|nr:hypothetical protein CPB85DRAFT_1256967 [Mucidula mucida]
MTVTTRKPMSKKNPSPANTSSAQRRRAAAKKATKPSLSAPSQTPTFTLNPTFPASAPSAGVMTLEQLDPDDAPTRVKYLPAGYVPRRPHNGFFWYVETRNKQGAGAGMANSERLKMYGQEWADVKAAGLEGPYDQMAAEEYRVYTARFPGYRYAAGATDRMSREQWKNYIKSKKLRVQDWTLATDNLFVIDAKGALCYTGTPPPMLASSASSSSASPSSSSSSSPPPNMLSEFQISDTNPSYMYPSFGCNTYPPSPSTESDESDEAYFAGLFPPTPSLDMTAYQQYPSPSAFDAYYANVDFASAFDYPLSL